MNTLNTKEAAAFLHLHPTTLLDRAKAGEIPAAKVGKCWVFIDVDLIAYIRSQYSQQTSQGDNEEFEQCHSTEERTRLLGGSKSLSQAARQYSDLLALPMSNRRKSMKPS